MGPRNLRAMELQPRQSLLPQLRDRELCCWSLLFRRQGGKEVLEEDGRPRKVCQQRNEGTTVWWSCANSPQAWDIWSCRRSIRPSPCLPTRCCPYAATTSDGISHFHPTIVSPAELGLGYEWWCQQCSPFRIRKAGRTRSELERNMGRRFERNGHHR